MAVTVRFILNNKPVQVEVEATEILVDTLRNRLGLTGTKKACGTGDCGACTVLINGEAVRSCILLTATAEGKQVLTIEGLGDPDHPHAIQKAFSDAGAVQCGYCIPGMVMTSKGLLDKKPNPTLDEIKEALSGNLCRCTGYRKIYEAVQLAAERINSSK